MRQDLAEGRGPPSGSGGEKAAQAGRTKDGVVVARRARAGQSRPSGSVAEEEAGKDGGPPAASSSSRRGVSR